MVSLFEKIWLRYDNSDYFAKYKLDHKGREWADEGMKALFIMLTGSKTPGGAANSVS
jgi:hypothetical protein